MSMQVHRDAGKYDPTDRPEHSQATGNDSGLSWNTSISYKTPIGLIPYFTASRQSTVVAGKGRNSSLRDFQWHVPVGLAPL
jgi:hypothetical protein